MSILGFFTVLFLIVCAVILAEMYREQHFFCVTHYEVHSPKITCTAEKDSVNRIIFLGDLHNHVYGKQNNKLFEAIKTEQPDLILIGGDMLVAKNDVQYQEALHFVSRLPQLCPVYYASGNHEQRIKEDQENYSLCYEEYRKKLQAEGVHFLENESCDILLGNQQIHISGLELPLIVNRKFRKADVTAEEVRRCLGEKHTTENHKKQLEITENFADNSYHILLAHNPSYMEAYKEWGADLILSGHLHGGCVRLPGIGGVITPQAFLFPKYSGEMTVEGEQTIIVSKGLGTHTFNVRLFNPAEVIAITLCR